MLNYESYDPALPENDPVPEVPVKQLRISGTDISLFRIVLVGGITPAAEKAASELQKYIALACGATLEIGCDNGGCVIAVGIDRSLGLGEDGLRIEATSRRLALTGGGDRGVLYAVYTLLEKYVGCRWYAAGVERILPAGEIDICAGTLCEQKPVFEYRDSFYENNIQQPEFRVKLKSNTDSGKRIPAELGGCIGYNGFVHTLPSYVPPAEYFESHPEYYALHDGKRTTKQLCLTNPEVLKIATENVLKRLRENPQRIISVSQDDNQDFCTCPACAAVDAEEGSHMGSLLRFVNAVADEVKKEFPDVMVDTLAYQYTRNVPSHTVPRDNVIIRLCSIECCFNHPLDDPDCPENVAFKKDIEDWNRICSNLYIWDYVTDFSHYTAPFPNYAAILANARFFADHHVTGVFEEGTYRGEGGDLTELHSYLLAKLLWEPHMSDAEYDAHMRDFLEGYYGAGWENIYAYLQLLAECVKGEHIGCFADPFKYLAVLASRIDEAKALWDKAEAAASSVAQLRRIRKSRLSVMYTDLMLNYDSRYAAGADSQKALTEENTLFFTRFFDYNVRLNEWETLDNHQPDLTLRIDRWRHTR